MSLAVFNFDKLTQSAVMPIDAPLSPNEIRVDSIAKLG